jgi:hypothetical protein
MFREKQAQSLLLASGTPQGYDSERIVFWARQFWKERGYG